MANILDKRQHMPGVIVLTQEHLSLFTSLHMDASPNASVHRLSVSAQKLAQTIKLFEACKDPLLKGLVPNLVEINQDLSSPGVINSTKAFQQIDNLITILNSNHSSSNTSDLVSSSLFLLREIRQDLATAKAYNDFPLQVADGLVRNTIRYLPPVALSTERVRRGFDAQACDLLVIGGGPTGIATTYYGGHAGLDTVLLESRYIASSMSDSRAVAVKLMRTSAHGSSLARPGVASPELVEEIGMPKLMHDTGLRKIAIAAREEMTRLGLAKFPDNMPQNDDTIDSTDPVTRAEAFGYFVQVLEKAADFKNVFVTEQAPVSSITWLPSEERFEVVTRCGHKLKPSYIALASGAVGASLQYCKSIPVLEEIAKIYPQRYRIARNENELQIQLSETAQNPETSGSSQWILADPLLGHPDIQAHVGNLARGTRAAVIGSGESAAKTVCFLLSLNSSLKVDLFCKSALEPSLGQNPAFGGIKDIGIRSIQNSAFANNTIEIVQRYFGTPITPETMHQLLSHVQDNRIRIFELGEKFDETNIKLVAYESSQGFCTEVQLASPDSQLLGNLNQQCAEMADFGIVDHNYTLIEDPTSARLARINGPIIMAAGYDRATMVKDDQILSQLREQGLIAQHPDSSSYSIQLDQSSGLFSAVNSHLALIGAVNISGAIDGVFSGGALRGLLMVNHVCRNLGVETLSGVPVLSTQKDDEELKPPQPVIVPNHELVPGSRFPGSNYMADMARRNNKGLATPVERFMLQRGDRLQDRVNAILGPNLLMSL